MSDAAPLGPPVVRPLVATDHDHWVPLFTGYRDFYGVAADPAAVERVWSWLVAPDHELQGLAAERDGALLGIAQWRRFVRPLRAGTAVFLDDLFTVPAARGTGVGRTLIAALQRVALEEGHLEVRWLT